MIHLEAKKISLYKLISPVSYNPIKVIKPDELSVSKMPLRDRWKTTFSFFSTKEKEDKGHGSRGSHKPHRVGYVKSKAWVRTALYLMLCLLVAGRAAPVQDPGWQLKGERDSLIPEPSWERSPSLISRLFTVRSSDCPLTGSDSFSFILILSLSPLSQAGNASVGTVCCSVDVPVIWSSFIQLSLSVSKHTTSVPSRTPWHLLQLWTGCGLFKFACSL